MNRARKNYAEVYYDNCEAETAEAVLLDIDGEKHWVPKSCCDPEEEFPSQHDGGGSVYMVDWLAERKGLV